MIRAEMYNSGDISGEMDKVVGYGSWFMYTDSRNEFIEKYCYDYVLNAARASILASVNEEEFIPEKIPPVLTQFGA